MSVSLDDWLKLTKGLQVYQTGGQASSLQFSGDILPKNLNTGSKFPPQRPVLPSSYNVSQECLQCLETIFSHPTVSCDAVTITDDNVAQIFVKFDLDVRITVDLLSKKCSCDPYLSSVTDVQSLVAALDDPGKVSVV